MDRPDYLLQLIRKKHNGMIKVITGVRRCGKSYLLFELYNASSIFVRHEIIAMFG